MATFNSHLVLAKELLSFKQTTLSLFKVLFRFGTKLTSASTNRGGGRKPFYIIENNFDVGLFSELGDTFICGVEA